MHRLVIVVVCVVALVAPAVARAQDAEALRRELEALKKQQEQYQKAIEALSQRLQKLESQPAPTLAQPPAPSQAGPLAQTPPPGQATPLSPIDLARPRQPFSLYQQRGSGQLLFDIGVAGDFVGNLTQKNVEKANAGTFSGRENRFFPHRHCWHLRPRVEIPNGFEEDAVTRHGIVNTRRSENALAKESKS
jgi:type II secretory pathway pseudopilin PulG